MTDPGGQDSKSPVMVPEITTPPPPALTSATSTMQTQEPDPRSPANHFRGLVIPDYHLHLLTPEPEEGSRMELRTTGEASTPSPLRTSDQDRREEHRQSNECPTNGATATSSPLKSKEPMRRHSVHRKPISTKPGRLASRKESAIHKPLVSSRSLDAQRSCLDEQLSRRNGLDVSPSEQESLVLNLKNGSVDDDIRQVHADRRNNSKDVVVDIDVTGRNHNHRGVELQSGNTNISNASQHTTRSLPTPSATRGRRFAFIPTTTTTGCVREHDHGHDQDHNQQEYGTKENRAPTPPPWALREFQVGALLENSSSSSEDQVTQTSSTPPPPRTLTATTTATTRTTPATTIAIETTESEHTTATTDEDVMTTMTWQPEEKNAASPKTSPGLRRISRPIPPRRSSLSCVAAPLGNAAGGRLDMMIPEPGRGRGRETDITFIQSQLTHDPTSNGKEATARSVSLPVKEKPAVVVHFSEEGLEKAKMEKEIFDRGRGVTEMGLEAVTAVQGERVTPLDTKGIEQQHPLDNVVPLTDDGNIERNPNVAMKVNGPTDNIPTHPRTYGTRIPIRPQGLSEHIDDVVRESARTAVMMKGCAKQTTMTKNPANGRYRSADCQADSSEAVAMTNPPHDAQRASHAHPQKDCNPAQKIEQRGDVTQVHGIDGSKESGVSGTSKEEEMKRRNKEMAIRLELHRKIEDEIRRQKRERRILPPPPPPPPKYPPPLPPPLAQRKLQQEHLLMLRHRAASSRGGDLVNNDNRNAPSLPPRDQQVYQKGSSSYVVEEKGEEKETNPLRPQFLPPRVAGIPEITVPQQQQQQKQLQPGTQLQTRQQQAVLLQGGRGGGAGTDARSRLPVPRIPTHPCHHVEVSTAATAAAITAVRLAEERSTTTVIANINTDPQTKPTPTTTTITTCRRIPVGTSPSIANRSSLKTTTTTTKTNCNSSNSENKPPSTGTAVSTKIHHPIITTTAAATALKPALEFLKAAVLLLAVVAAVWFLVACMAFDPDSGFWRCRRAGRGTVVSDVVVLALAGLFFVAVGVVGWYVAGLLGLVLSLDWVGLG